MGKRLRAGLSGVSEDHNMNIKSPILMSILSIVGFVGVNHGCGPDRRAQESDASGFISQVTKDAPVARKLNDAELGVFQHSLFLFRHTHVASALHQTLKPRFTAYMVQAILDIGGIHPDQLHRVLRQLLALNMDACGGASCSRVLGIQPDEINTFLDDTLKDLERSVDNGDSHLSETQIKTLASSLKRPAMVWHVHDFEVPVPPPGPQSAMPEFDGLCPLALVQSVGFRSNTDLEMRELRLSPRTLTESVDYRRQEPTRHQGASAGCHAFAVAALLSHSKYQKISVARNLSPERLLLENWVMKLGKNPQNTAQKDVEKLHKLAAEFRKARAPGGALAKMSAEQASRSFVTKHYIDLTIKEQAGNAQRNWSQIMERGALTRDAEVPQLSIARIEELTRAITRARMNALRSIMIFGLDKSSSVGLVKSLEKSYEPIFAAAKEGQRGSREDIRKELAGFKLRAQTFRGDRPDESLGLLLKDLIKYGPVYGSTLYHAITIVGFDAKNRRFFVRDSQTTSGADYEEIPADELAGSLRLYQVIEPR